MVNLQSSHYRNVPTGSHGTDRGSNGIH